MYQRRRSGKRQKNLLKMGDFLAKFLKRKKILLDILDCCILDVWHRAVGPQISAQTAPSKFKNNTLFVTVSTPAWMQQLRFMKQEIMDKVNAEWGKQEIRNIHFTIGDIPSAPAPPAGYTVDFNPRLLKERDKRLIRENLSRIEDEDLRGILERVMIKETIKRRLSE
ncbi:MAG: DUF721 domain-containing protein [Deltaproteobacteria bacterium]|nr:DUF721 domain-containing protein [Deltaproteobacteria bacterium]